jgi:hypothetical protein
MSTRTQRNTFIVRKNGKQVFPEWPGEILADGTIRLMPPPAGKPLPVTNMAACMRLGLDAKTVARQGSPAECLAHLGENEGGLVVVTGAAEKARIEAERRAYLATPEGKANQARIEVDRMFASAERLRNYPGEYFPAKMDAEDALKAWQAKYPDAARRERAARLRSQADHQRELATGALVYDCDGSFSSAYQQKRHEEFMAKAADLDAQAAEIVITKESAELS